MNMHTDQPRTPAGNPQGGQFAHHPGGSESPLTLTYTTPNELIDGYNEIPTNERGDFETYAEQMVELEHTTPETATQALHQYTTP